MRKGGAAQLLIIMTNYVKACTVARNMKPGSLNYIPRQLVEDRFMPLLHTILKEWNIGRNRVSVFARDGSVFQKIM